MNFDQDPLKVSDGTYFLMPNSGRAPIAFLKEAGRFTRLHDGSCADTWFKGRDIPAVAVVSFEEANAAIEATRRSFPDEFYIVNISHTHREHRYVTFWRPENKGYAWPLSWAGRYSRDQVMRNLDYYNSGSSNIAVPCSVVEPLGVPPEKDQVDGDAGPVVPATAENWKLLIASVVQQPKDTPQPEYKGARYRRKRERSRAHAFV